MRSARAWLTGLVLLAFAAGAASAQAVPDAPPVSTPELPSASTPPAAKPGRVVLMELEGAIGPASVDYVRRGLKQAEKENARLAVIQIDTPGGLDSSMRDIIKYILASPVPVASFVAPNGARAASAGTYILYASHIAAMTPASNLGAATPVAIGMPSPASPNAGPEPVAKGESGDAMTAKRLADASAYIRSLAQLRERNAEWGEKAVRESVSLSAQEAKEKQVIDFVARDVPDLLQQANG